MKSQILWEDIPQAMVDRMSTEELLAVSRGLNAAVKSPMGSDLRSQYEAGGLKVWLPAWVVLELEEAIKPVFERADVRAVLEQVRDGSAHNSLLDVGLMSRRIGRSLARVKMILDHLYDNKLIDWDTGFVWLTEEGAEELQRLNRRVDPALLVQGAEGGGE